LCHCDKFPADRQTGRFTGIPVASPVIFFPKTKECNPSAAQLASERAKKEQGPSPPSHLDRANKAQQNGGGSGGDAGLAVCHAQQDTSQD
jgi:hypothetical protein